MQRGYHQPVVDTDILHREHEDGRIPVGGGGARYVHRHGKIGKEKDKGGLQLQVGWHTTSSAEHTPVALTPLGFICP